MYYYILSLSICFLLVQSFYLGHLFWLKNKKQTPDNQIIEYGVSLIVCAKNEFVNLQKNLPIILNQSHSNFELLVVDDKSTDETELLIQNFQKNYPNLKYIKIFKTPANWNSKKWALQQGVKYSKFDYLLFSDADCYPNSEHWISSMTKELQTSDLVLGYGAYESRPGLLNKIIQYETYQTAIAMLGFGQKNIPYMAVGRNYACHKSNYIRFDWQPYQSKTGGDDDLFVNHQKLRTQVIIHPNAHTISVPKLSFKDYLVQKTRHISIGKAYTWQSKAWIASYNLSLLGFYLCFFGLLMYNWTNPILIGLFLFKNLILFFNFTNSRKHLSIKIFILETLYLDLIYVVFLWAIGSVALLAKNIKWK